METKQENAGMFVTIQMTGDRLPVRRLDVQRIPGSHGVESHRDWWVRDQGFGETRYYRHSNWEEVPPATVWRDVTRECGMAWPSPDTTKGQALFHFPNNQAPTRLFGHDGILAAGYRARTVRKFDDRHAALTCHPSICLIIEREESR